MRYPAADLLPGDRVVRPATDEADSTEVIIAEVLSPVTRNGKRVLRFRATADDRTGLIHYSETASVDVRYE